jgi:NAD(P) transhydrogenase
MYDFDLLCIGSGPAGQRAAVQAAKLGCRVAVVERRHLVGGICVDTGTIPSKTFREAVLFFVGLAGRFDWRQAVWEETRPTVEQLLARVGSVMRRETEVIERQLRRNGIGLLWGEASFKDPHTVVVESERGCRTVTATNILLAVGTRPAPPPGMQADGDVVITSDEVMQLKRLPRSMVVVGGGIIGIEYASMFASLGVQVTLVDKRLRLNALLAGHRAITRCARHWHRRHGADPYRSSGVGARGRAGLFFTDGLQLPDAGGVLQGGCAQCRQ